MSRPDIESRQIDELRLLCGFATPKGLQSPRIMRFMYLNDSHPCEF